LSVDNLKRLRASNQATAEQIKTMGINGQSLVKDKYDMAVAKT
jgi:hypothetical protein